MAKDEEDRSEVYASMADAVAAKPMKLASDQRLLELAEKPNLSAAEQKEAVMLLLKQARGATKRRTGK